MRGPPAVEEGIAAPLRRTQASVSIHHSSDQVLLVGERGDGGGVAGVGHIAVLRSGHNFSVCPGRVDRL